MTNEAKAVDIMQRTGQSRHLVGGFTESELTELAAIHDGATEETLADLVRGFWGRRKERLEAWKATDDEVESALARE